MLLHVNLGDGGTLTFDHELTGCGIHYALTLEIEQLGGSVVGAVGEDVSYAGILGENHFECVVDIGVIPTGVIIVKFAGTERFRGEGDGAVIQLAECGDFSRIGTLGERLESIGGDSHRTVAKFPADRSLLDIYLLGIRGIDVEIVVVATLVLALCSESIGIGIRVDKAVVAGGLVVYLDCDTALGVFVLL